MVRIWVGVEGWLHCTFRVQRYAIRDALLWLKANNPQYYGTIDIDDSALQALPEDGIPEELNACIATSSREASAPKEDSGYVPLDEESGRRKNTVQLAE